MTISRKKLLSDGIKFAISYMIQIKDRFPSGGYYQHLETVLNIGNPIQD